jgi:hypothetical protein
MRSFVWIVCAAGLAACSHRPAVEATPPTPPEVVAPSAAPMFGLLRVTRTAGEPIEGVLVSRQGNQLMLNRDGRIVLIDGGDIARVELLARAATPQPVVNPKYSVDVGRPPLFVGCFSSFPVPR